MSVLDPWRRQIRALIPRGFLRRDSRFQSLFISDYPRLCRSEEITSALRQAGFTVRLREDRLAQIGVEEEKIRRFLQQLPIPQLPLTDDNLYACSLARRLIAARTDPDKEPIFADVALMKALDAGRFQAIHTLAAYAARCQRQGLPLPSAAGKIILCTLADWKGEDGPC